MRQRRRPSQQRLPGEATPFMKGLQSRVLRFVRRYGVLNPGERALLAVSGGQDSSALLLIVSRLASEIGLEVTVAHFDHRLRSRGEGRDDEKAVRTMAQGLGLPLVTGSGDARRRAARRHESIEEAARSLRFAFLAREAKRLNAGVVVLGHTRDDRAETVLLHLLRGSGLDGLIGLRPRSAWPFGRGPALARPLLAVTRAETGRYCREAGLSPREDPTNLLQEATRNRLRHELLPSLREFNPRLDDALCRLGDAAAAAVAHLDAAADGAWQTLSSVERRAVAFPRDAFEELSPAVRARLLRRAVRHLAGASADVEAVHVEALEGALGKRRGAVALPNALTARVGQRDVRVSAGEPMGSRRLEETRLAVPGRTELPGWSVMAEIVAPPPGQPRGRSRLEALLDADAAGEPLVVRSRRAGDRLRPLGLGGEKKLQDVLVDAKVPEEERDGVPLVCAPWGIAWVVGQRLDERAALREGSRGAVRLRFRRRGAGR
ncbi:MAG: tRNA lysidine(34) synthetase TilS [Dehalococcoidia bacterium]|nr:tRNA lysidine(34) synthetase TilS [Dehalococcoidia bacterium]